jgi:exocyst complex protein 7
LGLQLVYFGGVHTADDELRQTGLLKAGSLELEELFRQTLVEDSVPVEPLHYITKGLFCMFVLVLG